MYGKQNLLVLHVTSPVRAPSRPQRGDWTRVPAASDGGEWGSGRQVGLGRRSCDNWFAAFVSVSGELAHAARRSNFISIYRQGMESASDRDSARAPFRFILQVLHPQFSIITWRGGCYARSKRWYVRGRYSGVSMAGSADHQDKAIRRGSQALPRFSALQPTVQMYSTLALPRNSHPTIFT